jgi:uncharacterized protein (DUF885 family)
MFSPKKLRGARRLRFQCHFVFPRSGTAGGAGSCPASGASPASPENSAGSEGRDRSSTRHLRFALLLAPILLLASCSRQTKPIDIEKLLQDFIGADLAMSPVTATQMGFHNYEGVNLDSILDDYSEKGIRGYRIFYNSMHVNAVKLDSAKLPTEVRVDLGLIRRYCEAQLLELDKLQSYRHNPTMYVELIGQAINGPFTLEYAAADARFRQIISRLGKVAAFLETAKGNLVDSPEVWNTVAQSENDGNIDLIDHQVRAKVPEHLKTQYAAAASQAITALREFNTWLKNTLSKHRRDWRLGHDLYSQKFNYQLDDGQTPDQTLAAAEAKLQSIRDEMRKEAKQLWPKYYGRRSAPADENVLISGVLAQIARDHTTPDKFFDQAKNDYERATAFVKEHHLLTLPKLDNMHVVPTPGFMRGVYAVAGFQPAPPLEPQLGAFFWITPIDPAMPKADIESKLREYNHYGLETVVIHEAMPGHFVQGQYANQVDSRSRAVLRAILANGPYVEGWAVYATQLMIDQGFDNSPEMKLTFNKQMLRVVANAILDIKMQTQGMTGQQALNLMINQTFQERQEAVAKVQRGQLTSCQLPTYFSGWQAWLRLRSEWESKSGSGAGLARFHDRALGEGALPMPVLLRLLLQ